LGQEACGFCGDQPCTCAEPLRERTLTAEGCAADYSLGPVDIKIWPGSKVTLTYPRNHVLVRLKPKGLLAKGDPP